MEREGAHGKRRTKLISQEKKNCEDLSGSANKINEEKRKMEVGLVEKKVVGRRKFPSQIDIRGIVYRITDATGKLNSHKDVRILQKLVQGSLIRVLNVQS